LANVQSQMQGGPQQQPQQQQPQLPPDLMAELARTGNLASVASLLSGTAGTSGIAGGGDASANQSCVQQPAAAAASAATAQGNNGGDDMRQRLLQQLSKTATAADSKPAAPPSLGHVGGEIRAGFQGQPSTAVSSSMTADAVKDERRKAPGSVIVPCRARGMPMDHNFKVGEFHENCFCGNIWLNFKSILIKT